MSFFALERQFPCQNWLGKHFAIHGTVCSASFINFAVSGRDACGLLIFRRSPGDKLHTLRNHLFTRIEKLLASNTQLRYAAGHAEI